MHLAIQRKVVGFASGDVAPAARPSGIFLQAPALAKVRPGRAALCLLTATGRSSEEPYQQVRVPRDGTPYDEIDVLPCSRGRAP